MKSCHCQLIIFLNLIFFFAFLSQLNTKFFNFTNSKDYHDNHVYKYVEHDNSNDKPTHRIFEISICCKISINYHAVTASQNCEFIEDFSIIKDFHFEWFYKSKVFDHANSQKYEELNLEKRIF